MHSNVVCLGKSLHCLHLWKTTFLRKLLLVGTFFFLFISLNISPFLSWTLRFLLRSPLIFFREFLFCEHLFSLVACKTLSFSWLQAMCLGDDHFEWTLRRDLLTTWTWKSKSHQIWDLTGIISLSTISVAFPSSSPSRTLIMYRLFIWMLPYISHRFFHTFSFLFFFVPWRGNLNGPAF